MKVSYSEGVAIHTDSESCIFVHKGAGEALTGVRAGQALSREIESPSLKRWSLRGADAVEASGRLHWGHNLEDLSERLKRGAYRAKPVRRAYTAKVGNPGKFRPLGVLVLEDKIVQRATTEVLSAFYEQDFVGFSYGFRPGRSPHQALDALTVGIMRRKVNWVLDADIRGFFDTLDHGWLAKFIEHRVADRRVVRLIQKWLKAGVLEENSPSVRPELCRRASGGFFGRIILSNLIPNRRKLEWSGAKTLIWPNWECSADPSRLESS